MIDALDGVTEQDQRLAGRIEEDGRACVVVVNKWDAVEKDSHTMTAMEKELRPSSTSSTGLRCCSHPP